MINTKKVIVKWGKNNKNIYENKGYIFTAYGNIFEVKINDLPDLAIMKVKVECDICKKIYETKYCNFLKKRKANNIDICKICSTKNTNIKRYGVSNPAQNKEIKEKIKQTNIKKYGVESHLKTSEIKEKIKQTNMRKYGVQYIAQVPEIKEKIKQTNIKKYGVKCSLNNKDVKKKAIDTLIKNYGVNIPLKNHSIKEKMQETNMKKYGVNNTFQIPKIREKAINSWSKMLLNNQRVPCSKQQKYLHNLLGGKLNYAIDRCFLDIAFPEEKIYIEYDGSGHDLSIRLGGMTQNQFKIKQIRRKNFLANKGWKFIRIISKKDFLPTDEIILFLINEAKRFLLNSRHSWIEIDIDKEYIECAEYKKDIKFSYLRRV